MTREELIIIGRRIANAEGTEQELEALADVFDKNVPRPDGSSLFFYPEHYHARRDDLAKYNPTVEEIVDLCLSYKPSPL